MSENVEKLYADMQNAIDKAKELFGEAPKLNTAHSIWKKVVAENLTPEQHKLLLIDNGIIVKKNKDNALDGLCKIHNNTMSDSQQSTGQKVVFKVASFENGQIHLLEGDYENYPDAEKSIEALPNGTYQVQKVFVKY